MSIIKGHIHRWWFLYKKFSHLLDNEYNDLMPVNFGWYIEDTDLIPTKNLNLLPEKLSRTCGCLKSQCKTKACCCFKERHRCSEFCEFNQCTNHSL